MGRVAETLEKMHELSLPERDGAGETRAPRAATTGQ
jgi:hypothetical protein